MLFCMALASDLITGLTSRLTFCLKPSDPSLDVLPACAIVSTVFGRPERRVEAGSWHEI